MNHEELAKTMEAARAAAKVAQDAHRRDMFAAAALTGLLSFREPSSAIGSFEECARLVRVYADALIAELDKPAPEAP